MMRDMWKRMLIVLAVVAMVAAACGGDDDESLSSDCESVDDVRVQLQWVAHPLGFRSPGSMAMSFGGGPRSFQSHPGWSHR